MIKKEILKRGAIFGSLIGILAGVVISQIYNKGVDFRILMISLFMIAGFFVFSFLGLFRISREKFDKIPKSKYFDWNMELNLKKLQILHNRYANLILFSGILLASLFYSLVYIVKDYPDWNLGYQIFFPITSFLFIFFLHLAFRWWFIMRSHYHYLQFQRKEHD